MNIIKKFREYREQRKQRKALAHTASVFGSTKVLEEKHLILWEQSKKRLYIAQPLAIVMLARGMEAWCNFLQNLYLYRVFKQQQMAWDNYVQQEQAKAIRERISQGVRMKPGEADRIRRAVRDNIQPEAVPVPPVEAFEFLIIDDNAQGDAQATVTFVGEYNPDTKQIDMAPWEDVKNALQNQKDE